MKARAQLKKTLDMTSSARIVDREYADPNGMDIRRDFPTAVREAVSVPLVISAAMDKGKRST